METVTFDGKEYTKSSVIAERFKYTSDYIGQLCRGRKVDARLVGRTWYVNLESVLEHRSGRYKTVDTPEITPKKAINNYLSRVDVEPILKNKTVRILRSQNGMLSELPVKYEPDDQALIPRVQKNSVSVSLPIKPAGAEVVSVKDKNHIPTNFKAEPLPEVSLSGHIAVAGIPEITVGLVTEPEPEPLPEPEPVMVAKPKPVAPKTVVVRPLVRPKKLVSTHRPATTGAKIPVMDITVPGRSATPPQSFKPALVSMSEVKAESSPVGIWLPVTVVTLALVCAVLIASVNLEILASKSSYNDRLIVQVANLTSYSNLLPK